MTEPISPEPNRTDAVASEDQPADDNDVNGRPPEEDSAPDDDEVADMRTVRKLRHEAAGLRVQLKEARAANEALEGAAARLAALEHAEIERIAAEQLHDGADIWRVSSDVQQAWYDDQFNQLQPDKVRDAVASLIEQKPHLGRPQRPPTAQPIEGLRGGASPEPKRAEVTWSSALRRTI